jgi:hypothetical protein
MAFRINSSVGRRPHRGEVVPLVHGELAVEHEVRHADDAVHRRPDLVAHVREKLALRAAGLHRAVAGVHQFMVARLELGGARVHRALEAVLLQEELLIALLDVGQHRVELIDQLADFVVVARVGAEVVAAAVAHQTRHVDEPRDGGEDQPRSRARQTVRNPGGPEQRDRDDGRESGNLDPDVGGVALHRNHADDLVVERNRPHDAQVTRLEPGDRFGARWRRVVRQGKAPRGVRAHVGGDQVAFAREQSRVEDVPVDRRGAQRVGRHDRILECQRRCAVGPHDVGEHRHVADQAGPEVDVVVGREDRAGHQQRHSAGGHGGRREFSRHRLAAKPGVETIEHDRSV